MKRNWSIIWIARSSKAGILTYLSLFSNIETRQNPFSGFRKRRDIPAFFVFIYAFILSFIDFFPLLSKPMVSKSLFKRETVFHPLPTVLRKKSQLLSLDFENTAAKRPNNTAAAIPGEAA